MRTSTVVAVTSALTAGAIVASVALFGIGQDDEPHGMRFNPAAKLDTSQVQDRRGWPPPVVCQMDTGGDYWLVLPCVYTFGPGTERAGTTVTINRQP